MTATSFDFPPYNYQVKDKDGNAKGWDGAEYRLTEMIGRSMNFKFELKTPTDGGLWGGKGKFLKQFFILVLFQNRQYFSDFVKIHRCCKSISCSITGGHDET